MALALFAALSLSVASFAGKAAEGASIESGKITLSVEESPFALVVSDADGDELFRSKGAVSYRKVTGQHIYHFVLWYAWTRGFPTFWTRADQVVSAEEKDGALHIDLSSRKDGPVLVTMKAFFTRDNTLRVETKVVDGEGINRTRLKFERDRDDLYYGMGERVYSAEHSKEEVSVWTEENGLGLSHLSKIWPKAPFNPFPKGRELTYYPMPYFLNAPKGYGFLLDDHHFSRFNFGKRWPTTLSIENWNDSFDFMIFYGPSPLEVMEAQTEFTGRIRVPAKWAFAPMNAVIHSGDSVRRVAKQLRDEKIPTTAIWSESWWWRTEWEVNRERYPEYEDMIDDMHRDGFRHLAYYQPYITVDTEAYKEGDAKGYFIKNKKGETYDFTLGLWPKAQLDLTNPEAREWWKESFFEKSEEMGVDGWMHDFGEHIPPDSVAYDGRSGWELHNEYPLLWHKLGEEFWQEARPDGDYFMYIRAGYTGAWKYIPTMWTGDQNSNFERYDGLRSNVPSILSVSLSGHPILSTDIAGFNCFVNRQSDRELFMRWTELGALLPIMRIHRGQAEICPEMWRFNQDRETLDHFKKYAVLHTALFPYYYTMAHEAAETGHPITRHLMLHYPDDMTAREQDYQYMLGDRVLVAPVLDRDAREWEVYLPEGDWAHWWTGEVFSGPATVTVPADLGEAPFFVMAGKILPMFDSQIDTLVEEDRDDLNGWDDANSSVEAVFYGTGADEYELWDGTVISCEKKAEEAGDCEFKGAPVKRKYSADFR